MLRIRVLRQYPSLQLFQFLLISVVQPNNERRPSVPTGLNWMRADDVAINLSPFSSIAGLVNLL